MGKPFFVVTTGRSGSLSLALTLSRHPVVCAIHEPWRGLIQGSWQRLREGSPVGLDPESWRALVPCPAGPQRVGIVDQKLAAFLPELVEAFPEAAFVWLVRDGRDVVRSGLARGWYTEAEQAHRGKGSLWQQYRWRGDEVDFVPADTWAAMTATERNAWYWAFVNRTIREGLAEARHWFQLRLEEATPQGMTTLQRWLGLDPVNLEMLHVNQDGRSARIRLEMEEFTRWAGAEMDRLYPDWRGEGGEDPNG